MSAGLLVQALVAGAAAGAVYAIVGLGYGLVYRMSEVLNFAHGDLVSAATYALLLAVGGGAAVGVAGLSGVTLAGGLLAALLVGAAAAVALERAAVRPFLERRAAVGWIAATVAAGLLVRAVVALRFQAESYTVPDVLPVRDLVGRTVVDLPGGGVLQLRALLVLGIALALAVAFDRWLGRSRTGRAMAATVQDEEAARLCGLSPERLRLLAWIIAGLLAAVAGVLVAPTRPVTVELGVVLGLKGTAAAVLGRLGSARGTVAAGLAIGIGEALVTTLSVGVGTWRIGPFPGLQDIGVLGVLVLLLALAPGFVRQAGEAID